MPRETVRKGVRATLRAWIWQVYGGQTGPKSTVSVARKATLQAPPRLFGQFLRLVFSETRLPNTRLGFGLPRGRRAPQDVQGYPPTPYDSQQHPHHRAHIRKRSGDQRGMSRHEEPRPPRKHSGAPNGNPKEDEARRVE